MLLDYPKIYVNDQLIGHGGNQDWFIDPWAQKAGCASVSATDIYIYYNKDTRKFDQSVYLEYMTKMFKIMTPGKHGFPYVYIYGRRLSKLLDNCSFTIMRRPHVKEACNLITASIDQGNPLGLLILKHRRRAVRDDLWHWVTIVGYEPGKKGLDIYFLDCGELKKLPARILFEKSWFNVVKMISFAYCKK